MLRRVLIVSFCVLVCLAIGVYAIVTTIEHRLQNLSESPIEDVDLSIVPDGEYAGIYTSMPVSAKVNVTVQNHRILTIDLVEHVNGQGKPAEAILDDVLDGQSLDVDVVAGATYSSKVILKAIEDALVKATAK